MSGKGLSRNDPCRCGSGKKFKHCCIDKGIDWSNRRRSTARDLLPNVPPRLKAPPLGRGFPGLFGVVDERLKQLARSDPAPGGWKPVVEGLTDATPEAERLAAYRAVREAGALPPDPSDFLVAHVAQWVPTEEDDLDRHWIAFLTKHGRADLADLYSTDRLEFDRRYERGRQFFFGPPDEELARHLRQRGVLD